MSKDGKLQKVRRLPHCCCPQLKLDKTYTGEQTLGGETIVEVITCTCTQSCQRSRFTEHYSVLRLFPKFCILLTEVKVPQFGSTTARKGVKMSNFAQHLAFFYFFYNLQILKSFVQKGVNPNSLLVALPAPAPAPGVAAPRPRPRGQAYRGALPAGAGRLGHQVDIWSPGHLATLPPGHLDIWSPGRLAT